MKTFVLHLQSASQYDRIPDVTSFVGLDASGSFGILPGHERAMTCLAHGIAQYRTDDQWTYIAAPGGLLYFVGDSLVINTRRYYVHADFRRIVDALGSELRREEEKIKATVESVEQLERNLLRRIWDMERGTGGLR